MCLVQNSVCVNMYTYMLAVNVTGTDGCLWGGELAPWELTVG